MCPICDLLGLGGLSLLLGPRASRHLLATLLRWLRRPLPLGFVATSEQSGGWQSLPPIPATKSIAHV